MKPHSTHREASEQAAMWLARRDAGFDQESEDAFERWLRADPAHPLAWQKVSRAWDAFVPVVGSGKAPSMIVELNRRQRRRQVRRQFVAAACLVAVVAGAAWAVRRPHTLSAVVATVPTHSGAEVLRPEHRVLSDGTAVDLNTGAKIEVAYSPSERKVRLLAGEAHFSVVHNAARPFEVDAGGVVVHDVGTQFSVRLKPEVTEVLVTEGEVKVEAPAAGGSPMASKPVLVSAGNLVSVLRGEAAKPLLVEPASSDETRQWLAWRGPRLALSSTSLADAVAALNRENTLQISVADPALAQMRLSGVFRVDNAEGFVRLLETSYGVRVERRDNFVVLRSAP